VQCGSPQEIYRAPNSRFVADFIGSANFIAGTVNGPVRDDALTPVATPQGTLLCAFASAVDPGARVLVTVRPEDFTLADQHPGAGLNVLTGKIAYRVFLGEMIEYIVDHGGGEIRVRARPGSEFAVGQAVHLGITPEKCIGLRS